LSVFSPFQRIFPRFFFCAEFPAVVKLSSALFLLLKFVVSKLSRYLLVSELSSGKGLILFTGLFFTGFLSSQEFLSESFLSSQVFSPAFVRELFGFLALVPSAVAKEKGTLKIFSKRIIMRVIKIFPFPV
jgi:hypothetical protein